MSGNGADTDVLTKERCLWGTKEQPLQPALCRAQQTLLLERGCVCTKSEMRVGQSLANQRGKEQWQGQWQAQNHGRKSKIMANRVRQKVSDIIGWGLGRAATGEG